MERPILSGGATETRRKKDEPTQNIRLPRNSNHLEFREAPVEMEVGSFGTFGSLGGSSQASKGSGSRRMSVRRASLEKPWEDMEPDTFMRVQDAGEFDVMLRKFPEGEVYDVDSALELTDQVIDTYRRELRAGTKVLELGCGLGLPSMTFAALGATTYAVDLERALGPLKCNAALNGYPQDVWEVVGGKRTGGLLCQQEMDFGDLKERLAVGTLVEQVERQGNCMKFKKLRGVGPEEGWVKVKRWGCDDDLVRSPERPVLAKTAGELFTFEFNHDPRKCEALMKRIGGKFFDIIVCSDIVYEPAYGSPVPLADCLEKLCGPNTSIFVSIMRRMYDGAEGFMERLQAGPLLCTPLKPSQFVERGKLEMFMLRRPRRSETFYRSVNGARPPGSFMDQIEGGAGGDSGESDDDY
eukprot:TRINITY_DN90206_c0_g1_i1.p1 TRINITY_DN90206_c0_g1~~TRINITY_DN90206_c0_g1_i1.p1  ORF type:complete len:411 (+),score=106.97 TRINITY_DN90206_c0_g1_i1:124-1356(+)